MTETPPNLDDAGPGLSAELTEFDEPADQSLAQDVPAILATMTVAETDPTPPPDQTPPTEQEVKDQGDFYATFAKLQENADFNKLLAGRGDRIKYVPIVGTSGTFKYLLRLTAFRIKNGEPDNVRIYLNSLESRVLRATDPANYSRLLQETIIHETIHAHISINGTKNDLNLGHMPNAANNVNNGFGNLGDYMLARNGKSNNETLRAHRMKDQGLFLDIVKNSQAFIKKIVP